MCSSSELRHAAEAQFLGVPRREANGCPRISVIVPAFREAENLRTLVPKIQDVLRCANVSGEIIIVDDNSGDGTDEIDRLSDAAIPVRLILRKCERGLSSAVVEGMRRASGDLFVVMDGDWSHPPEAIPALADAIDNGSADFSIGSRYVEGGGVDDNWGTLRRINSMVATWLVRPLTTARDPLAGFFAISRDDFTNSDQINHIGYKIGLELIVKCGCRRVREIPIQFLQRRHGESKLGFRQQLEFLKHIVGLYCYVLKRWVFRFVAHNGRE